MKKLIIFFLVLTASLGTFANSFTGFQATTGNKMGNQIYTQGLIQNTHNITLIETDATKHQYNINLTNGGTGTFQMGGVTFSYTNSEAGKTAYKTYDYYIQPNGVDREIIIPTESGEQVKIVLMEACAGILVNGVSRDFVEGDNILTATGSSIVLKNSSAKPKISAILSLGGGSTPTPDPSITEEAITVRLDPSSCSSWSTVRLWAWTDEGNLFDSWPGQIVSPDSDGWYSYTFDASITSVSIIWNNGEGDQTVDITDVTSSTCYALNSTIGTAITISVVDCSSGSSQGGTPVSGKYKIGDLYYNLDATNLTAEVTCQLSDNWDNYKGLTSANIPDHVSYSGSNYAVESIGGGAFFRCKTLTSVVIPNSIKEVGEGAFSLTGVKANLTSPLYNSHVFIMMPYFSGSYVIPNGIKNIASGAFSDCSGLTSIEIPNSVTNIGRSAFSGCSGLNAVHIFDLSAWCNILFPSHNGNTANPLCYAHHLYLNNSEITNLIIPNSITHISANAFNGANNITSVTIPSSVVSIGAAAFEGCKAIRSVTCEGAEPPYIQVQDWYYDEIFRGDWGFNVYVPCGSLEEYKNAQWWKEYASQMRYLPFPYMISQKAVNGYVSFPSIDSLTICDESVQVTAIPDRGCYFVRWADGNTENPRTIELTQDTTMEAIFDYLLEGKCGKDSALTWTFEPASMALNITGKGALSENYTYGRFIESLTIGNEVTTIGEDAFYKCNNLKNVIIGSSVKVLEEYAFYRCSAIESFTCYGQRPPTVNQNALYGLDYSTIIYVPADYLETYKMHDAWGLYDVRPLGAKSTETTDVNVTPAENTAEVVWPAVSGAATYELVIKDKSGNVICTLIFNSNGQLTSIAFNAPSRDQAPQQTQAAGFSFTVTGLENGTSYDLTITSKDSNGGTLNTKTVSFSTTGESQGVEDVQGNNVQYTKVLRNGQIYILRGEKVYTLQGQEVK